MSFLGPDPGGPFESCPICGYDMDYTQAYDHRKCIPQISVIGWYICETCNRSPWDCRCWSSAVCAECDVSVEDLVDLDGLPNEKEPWKCPDSSDGFHRWRVPDGDSFRVIDFGLDRPAHVPPPPPPEGYPVEVAGEDDDLPF